jgi:hypothetical protein
MSKCGVVSEETWRITPRLLEEEEESSRDRDAREEMKSMKKSSGKGAEFETRAPHLRRLAYGLCRGRTVEVRGEKMKVHASADGEEIVANGGEEGLIEVKAKEVIKQISEKQVTWKTVKWMLDKDGYTTRRWRPDGPSEENEEDEIIKLLERASGNATYEFGPEVKKGDVCIFPPQYFGTSRKYCGVVLTNRTTGTREGNETKREFVDVALIDTRKVHELNIEDQQWKVVIRAGSLRKHEQ